MKHFVANVQLLVEVREAACAVEQSLEANVLVDCVLTPLMKKHDPESRMIDWRYTNAKENPVEVEVPADYQPDADFDFPTPPKGNVTTQKVFLVACTNSGMHLAAGHNLADTLPDSYVLVAEKEVEFELKPEQEIVQAQITGIEKAQQKLKADCHVQVQKLEERKQSLLAIGHQPAYGVPVSDYEGLVG